jgi:hypothetical protein
MLVFGWGICSTLHVIEHTCICSLYGEEFRLHQCWWCFDGISRHFVGWTLPCGASGGIDMWESMFALLLSIQVGMYHHCIYPIWMFYKWIHWHLYYEILRKINRIFESMKMMDKVCTLNDKLYFNIQHLWVQIMKHLQTNFHFDHRFSVFRGRLCTLHVDGKSCLC